MPPKTKKIKKISDRIQPNLITVKNTLSVSLRRIATATGKAVAVVNCYFNGKKNPPEDWINTFCAVYCVDKDWLINGTATEPTAVEPADKDRTREGIAGEGVEETRKPVFTGQPALSVFLKSSQNAGDRVRAVRKEAGLTQTEFGKRIGISQHAVFDLEKDNTKLTPFSAGRIEEQFNVGADWLMFGDEGKKNFPVSDKLIKWLWKNEDVRERLWREMELQTQTATGRTAKGTKK